MNEHDVSNAAPADEPAEVDETSVPSVDELEERLRDLQRAMDQLQAGDLDAAERAIESLEDRIGSPQTEGMITQQHDLG